MYQNLRVSVVIPALNESLNIDGVVKDLVTLESAGHPIIDQIVVCDNGSIDGTDCLARDAGAQVVYETYQGYGAACLKALSALKPTDVVVFVDGDQSADAAQVSDLLDEIGNGADLVIGARIPALREQGALSTPQRFGNWLAARLITLIWRKSVTDLGPFRAIKYDHLIALGMADKTFGWTVEMQVKAIINHFKVREIPVSCKRRLGKSKISGTLRGIWGAGCGILGMIGRLWYAEKFSPNFIRTSLTEPTQSPPTNSFFR